MRKNFLAFIAFAVFLCAGLSPAQAAPWVIDALDMNIVVRDDNSYVVTETYDVTFNEKRHGIIRELPLLYLGAPGEVRDVKVEGAPFTAWREKNNMVVRIGDADKWADTKTHYILRYIYDVGGDRLRNKDEFVYNLIADYDAPITKMTFRVEMPHPFDVTPLNFTQGERGSVKNDAVEFKVNGAVITGRLKAASRPHELMTIALPLPDGYYTAAVRKQNLGTFICDYWWGFVLGFEALALALWAAVGKNKQIFPSVQFYPPQGVTPAEIGYIIDGSADPMDIISMIIYWAGKGCLTIEEITRKTMLGLGSQKGFMFRKLNNLGSDAKSFEKRMFKEMFAFGDGSEVTTFTLEATHFFLTLDAAAAGVTNLYAAKPETRIYAKGMGWRGALVCLPALLIAALAGFVPTFMSTGDIQNAATSCLLALPFMVAALIYGAMVSSLRTATRKAKRRTIFWCFIVPTLLAAYGVYQGCSLGIGLHIMLLIVGACVLGLLAMCFPIILAFRCSKRTELGDRYMELVLGFKAFLTAAERDKINMLVNENPNYFYDVLPYVVALGVTDKWARNFEELSVPPPDWYRSDTRDRFRANTFAVGIGGSLKNLSDTVSNTVQSSRTSSSGGRAGGTGGSWGGGGSSGGGSAGSGAGGGSGKSW
ncbi:hypothetical protein FACS1894204_01070 [Synergistales bacterium]|nr:hypothetical protein FACS1894204_01070 [Synergistales bacterium]